MKATLVPDQLTPLAPDESTVALHDGFGEVLQYSPSDPALALLWAQWALETGRGRSMHMRNFGNIKAGPQYEGYYCQFRCNEYLREKVAGVSKLVLRWFDPPHPQTNFRAYLKALAGATDYVRFLATKPRYARAWACVLEGNPPGFVHELKVAGYFTAHEAPYLRAVDSLFRERFAGIDGLDLELLDAGEDDPTTDPDPEHSTLTLADLLERALELRFPMVLTDDDYERMRAERDAAIREMDE